MRLLCAFVLALTACSHDDSTGDGAIPGDASVDGLALGDASVDGSVPGDAAVTPPGTSCAAPIAAADVSMPTTVVGTGTAGSCTEAALGAALATGGVITFNCGGATTITVTQTIELPTDRDVTIDGGGKITLDGGGTVRILDWNHLDFRKNTHVLTLQHLTLSHGHIAGTMPYAPAPAPCSTGYYDGSGGALHVRDGVLHVIDCTFTDNAAEPLGPDVGGGAIYLEGALNGVIVGSIFSGNTGSNSGAVGVLNSDLDVYNSTFTGNKALGNGANSDDSTKCSVKAANGQYQVGSGGNAGAIGIDGGSDGTHTFCGDVFKNNQGGVGALGGAIARTPDLAKQTTVIDRCWFDGNQCDSGGAAYFHNSTLEIIASTFSNNTAPGIGAIQADGTTFDFTNVTFSGNHSTTSVGASIALFGGDGTLLNCTFADNVCDADNMFGAAIFGMPNLTIQNTIFDNNTAKNPGAPMQCQVGTITGSGNMQFPATRINGGTADDLCVPGIDTADDPMLGSLGDHGGAVPTIVPQAGSAAIGKGTDCPPTDARGMPRNAGSCTAGAVEGSM